MVSRDAFEGVDLLDTVERLSIPSYAIDRQGIIRWLNPAARGGRARVSRVAFEGVELLDTVERLSIPSYPLDRRVIIRWVKPAARAVAGDVAGRHFTDVVAPSYRSRAREQFLRKLRGKDATDFELEMTDAHGRVLADVSSVAIRDPRDH